MSYHPLFIAFDYTVGCLTAEAGITYGGKCERGQWSGRVPGDSSGSGSVSPASAALLVRLVVFHRRSGLQITEPLRLVDFIALGGCIFQEIVTALRGAAATRAELAPV